MCKNALPNYSYSALRAIAEDLRRTYPPGTRVQLLEMHDDQAPPIGTLGTVRGVDDMASILVAWDNGSSLSVIFGVDSVQIVS